MPKIVVSGRGGSGKSTLVALLARTLGQESKVLVVDADESNLGLGMMLGLDAPEKTLLDHLGGRQAIRGKLLAMIRSEGKEKVPLFAEKFMLDDVPAECVKRDGRVAWLRIGKIDHSMEGCACPMGALARQFLNSLEPGKDGWVLVDAEAGVEHFGRGVLEGAEAALLVVDPSFEAVLMADKAKRLTEEAHKKFLAVLNKVDGGSEPVLREMLAARGIEAVGALPFSSSIATANLSGRPLDPGALEGPLKELAAILVDRLGVR